MSRWTLVNSCFGFQTLLRSKVSGCGEGGLSNPKSETGVACALTHGVQLHSLWIWRLVTDLSAASGTAVMSHGQGLWPGAEDTREGWRWHMCKESMPRQAAWSAGSIQVGPEEELEPSTPAESQRQGLISPGWAERGPRPRAGWAGTLRHSTDLRIWQQVVKICFEQV